jgi:hypothetical protein
MAKYVTENTNADFSKKHEFMFNKRSEYLYPLNYI